jgi:hypothetical protein
MAPNERMSQSHLTHTPLAAPAAGWRGSVALGVGWLGGLCAAALLLSGTAQAQSIQCHLAYAGATRTFLIAPSSQVNEPSTLVEGASFVFKVLNRIPPAPGAGVKISAYGVFSEAPYLLHEATYLSTTSLGGAIHGFTGLQLVREPLRHNELAYWCERLPG